MPRTSETAFRVEERVKQERTEAGRSWANRNDNGKGCIFAGFSADPCLTLDHIVTYRVLVFPLMRREIRRVQELKAVLHAERRKALTFSLRDFRQLSWCWWCGRPPSVLSRRGSPVMSCCTVAVRVAMLSALRFLDAGSIAFTASTLAARAGVTVTYVLPGIASVKVTVQPLGPYSPESCFLRFCYPVLGNYIQPL
jgi:hypothetical protein